MYVHTHHAHVHIYTHYTYVHTYIYIYTSMYMWYEFWKLPGPSGRLGVTKQPDKAAADPGLDAAQRWGQHAQELA